MTGVAVVTFAFWTYAHGTVVATPTPDPPRTDADARRALAEANAALAAGPARSADARRALDRAVAARIDRATKAEAYFRLGVLDEEETAFTRALTNYGACVDAMPTSRWARNARKRVAWLGERSEGDFVPLVHLRRIQRDPALADDPNAVEGLAREAETFPPGTVRGEARMLVAESWLKRMNRPGDAMDELRKVLDDPRANRGTAMLAERELVGVWLVQGRLDAAANEVARYPFDAKLKAEVRHRVRARALQRSAMVALAALVGLMLVAIAWKYRRRRAMTVGVSLRTARPPDRLVSDGRRGVVTARSGAPPARSFRTRR
jgi:hypothetical protein